MDLDGPVSWVDHGGPDGGQLVVAVHGLGGSHANWHDLAPLLTRSHRVVAVDLAGHGRTPRAGRSASIPANCGLLGRFLSHVDDRPAVLLGNSMGGALSLLHAAAHPTHRDPWWLPAVTFAVAIYGGYFGAAAGVMLLAVYLLSTGEGLATGNALRNVVLLAANLTAAIGFVVLAPVAWSAALPLAMGLFVGGRLGPRVVRRAPQTALRRLIALAGLGLAVHLAVQAYG